MKKGLAGEKLGDALRLIRTENIGSITFSKMLQNFGSCAAVLEALPKMPNGERFRIPSQAQIEDEIAATLKLGGGFLVIHQKFYPHTLLDLADPPIVITYRGRLELLKRDRNIAIVGARNASGSGMAIAAKFSQSLGEHNFIITSGLARGIDTAAHKAAVGQGTIAVIAGGIDNIFPLENNKLYQQIAEDGLIICENALGKPPAAHSFHARNRIIAALSQGVIVIEAAQKSGTLITTNCAAEIGREIFAVPGNPLDPRCEGSNNLIKDGAVMTTCIDDILQNLHLSEKKEQKHNAIETMVMEIADNIDISQQIYEQIGFEPLDIDEIARNLEISAQKMQNMLMELELEGKIKRISGGKVIRCEYA